MSQGSYMRTVVRSKLKVMGFEDIGDLPSSTDAAARKSFQVLCGKTQPPKQATPASSMALSLIALLPAATGTEASRISF